MRAALGVIAAAVVLASGCVKQQDWIDRTLVTVNVTGVWEGTFTGTAGSGRATFVLQQQGPKVKGETNIVVTAWITAVRHLAPTETRIEGTVSGDTFAFQFVTGPQGHGEFQVNGDEMIGWWSRSFNQMATLRRQQ